MSIQSAYRRMPVYLAIPLVLLVSAVAALTLAVLGGATLVFLLGKIHGPGDLGDAMLAFFCAAPSIAVLAFVSCFSILVNWHHATSWRTPTFALFSALSWFRSGPLISVGSALHGTCREPSLGWLAAGSFIRGRRRHLTLIMSSKRKSKGAYVISAVAGLGEIHPAGVAALAVRL